MILKDAVATGNSVSALAAFEGQVGSRDRGDPLVSLVLHCSYVVLIMEQTTNVFVANLPLGITEHNLGMFFARHGPVGSVRELISSSRRWLMQLRRSRSCGHGVKRRHPPLVLEAILLHGEASHPE